MFRQVVSHFRWASFAVVLARSLRDDDYYSERSDLEVQQATHPVAGPATDINARVQKAYSKDLVDWDWFKAKSNLLFAQMTHQDVKADSTRTKDMETLVELRTEFLCAVFFNQGTDCLHDGGVPKPVRIPSNKISEYLERKGIQCTATALGSVTMLSDLDFTISCTGLKTNIEQTAKEEVRLAENLVNDAEIVLRGIANQTLTLARVFDTNVYTDTFSYSRSLPRCPCSGTHAGTSVGFAIYAFARGWRDLAKYLHQSCKSARGPLSLSDYINKFANDTAQSKKASEYSKHQLSNLISKVPVNLASMSEGHRTKMYFDELKHAIGVRSEFCSLVPLALMYANEAYWTSGAIYDVVFDKATLTTLEVIESILMNLGYALEHAVHEFTSPYAGSEKHGAQHRCSVGDGIIKFGKYFQRIEMTLKKKNDDFLLVTKHNTATDSIFGLSRRAMELKKEGKTLEDNKDSLGLPRMYLKAFEDIAGFNSSSNKVRGLCGFAWDLANASMEIYEHVVSKYAGPSLELGPHCST